MSAAPHAGGLPPVADADHALGPAGAAVTLVHYGDLECPYSADAWGLAERLRAEAPERVRVVWRHFPLRLHPHALHAALAAEAVGPDAFWPFLARLFQHPFALRDDQLAAHAAAVGADAAAVRQALRDERAAAAVLAQKRGGVRAGVRSTLQLWIDGTLAEEDALEPAVGALAARLRGV